MRCNCCESFLCDHNYVAEDDQDTGIPYPCSRPADPRFYVLCIGRVCTQCVSNIGATWGIAYIKLDAKGFE